MKSTAHRRAKRTHTTHWIFLGTLLMVSANAQAYLDPGSGSMLLQVILGGFAAVGVALKLYWHRIKAALGFGKKPEPTDG